MKAKPPPSSSVHGAYVRCAQVTIDVLFHGKWHVQILSAMRRSPVRIGQLGRLIPGASKKVLAQSLRKLEADGIVVRRDLSEIVLHVEYELDPEIQEGVVRLLDGLSGWGASFLKMDGHKGNSRDADDS